MSLLSTFLAVGIPLLTFAKERRAKLIEEHGSGNCDDTLCGDCFECDADGLRCVPVTDCISYCDTDGDCERPQFCNTGGVCEDWPTTCYHDEECLEHEECSYTLSRCVEPAGCCAGLSERATPRCLMSEDQATCDRKSSCHWVSGDGSDCEWVATADPVEPGCCTIGDTRNVAYEKGWDIRCTTYFDENECSKPSTADGHPRCLWTPSRDFVDCSALWDAPNPEAGCCAGDASRKKSKCALVASLDSCDRMSSCHWIDTEDPSECDHLDADGEDPGCCVIRNPSNPFSKWFDQCSWYWSERDCSRPIDTTTGDGACKWTETRHDFDCSTLWPSPPPMGGCCAGNGEDGTAQCIGTESAALCDRMSSCHWVLTDDVSDCEWVGHDTPTDPGCCFLSGFQNPNSRWDTICKDYWFEDDCLRPMDYDENPRCSWTASEEMFDCAELWPPRPSADNPAAGCCAGDAPHAMEPCGGVEDETMCTRMSMCHWVSGERSGCEWDDDDDPLDPGCCVADPDPSNGEEWERICSSYWNQEDCLTPKAPPGDSRCQWNPTALNVDCILFWSMSPSPTNPPSPGPTTPRPTMDTSCAPSGALIYFDDESLCATYWADGHQGDGLQCSSTQMVSWNAPNCGCGCMPPTDEPTAAPTTVDPTTSPTADPSGAPTTEPTDKPTVQCPPPGADVLVASSDICILLRDGFWGGITCAAGWEPWFLDCGCGCTPMAKPPPGAKMMFSDTVIPHGLDSQLPLTSALVLFVAVLAIYQLYSYWASNRNDGYQKVEERPNYQL